jgi:uncharacterized MAPEG superfamily protein
MMTIAYWCILLACLLPWFSIGYAKFLAPKAAFSEFDNEAPRDFLLQLKNDRKRAVWAEKNTYEALPLFIAAVLVAHQAVADQYLINVLAALFVVLRVIYIGLYIANLATLRTVVWVSAIGCSFGMFLISI